MKNLLLRITKLLQQRDQRLYQNGRTLLAPAVELKGKQAEVLVYGSIGLDFWGDGIGAEQFNNTIMELPSTVKEINVRINSPGGHAFDGFAMLNTLRRAKPHVRASIDGLAASAATILTLGADEVEISEPGSYMIHNAQGFAIGDQNELRATADILEGLSSQIAELYADRSGQSLSEIRAMLDAETWFNPREAVEAGFADSTFGVDSDDAPGFLAKAANKRAVRMSLMRSRNELAKRRAALK